MPDTTPSEPRQYAALPPNVYKALEQQCPKTIVTSPADPTYVAYCLGAQHVLKLLREGFVIG